MANSVPKVYRGRLELGSEEAYFSQTLEVGSQEWLLWLEHHRTFRFELPDGEATMTARREQRAGGMYWYAYYRKSGMLYTAYLGKAELLSPDRLNEVATSLVAKARRSLQKPVRTSILHEESKIDPILVTKLSVPPLAAHVIVRPRLIDKLQLGMHKKLTLICAPAGSGKTTLLSSWAWKCAPVVGWLSLDEKDNDRLRFWRYIITALEKVVPDIGEYEMQLSLTTPVEAVLTSLVNIFAAIPYDFGLVLDDYHLIHDPDINQLLIFFLDHLPPQAHLFISSRTRPALSLSRLRSHGQLNEVQIDELSFTDNEVTLFLRQVMEFHPSHELVDLLMRYTEGWITGIQLMAISLQHHENPADFSHLASAIIGDNTYLFEYFAEEVFQRQSQQMQDFLLKTSVPDRFCSSLCLFLTDQNSARDVQDYLKKVDLFLVPLDHQQYWYRYHHLFRDFLRERLRKSNPEQLSGLHQRACSWYEEQHYLSEAVEHALLAADYERAVSLLVRIGEPMMRRNEVNTLLRWMQLLPESFVRSSSLLSLIKAWLLMATGQQTDLIEPWLQLAEHKDQDRDSAANGGQEGVVKCMIAVIRAHLFNIKGDVSRSITFAHQALEYLPQGDLFQRGLCELILGSAYWLNEDISDADHAFFRAHQIGLVTDNLYTLVFALYGIETVQMAYNHYQRAFDILQQIFQLVAEREACAAFWMTAAAYLDAGIILYEWNDLGRAEEYLQRGIALSKRWEHKLMHMYGNTLLARVKYAQGDQIEAKSIIYHTEQYMMYDNSYSWIVVAARAQHMKLALAQADIGAMSEWEATFAGNYVSTLEQLVLARLALFQNRLDEACERLGRVQQRAQAIGQERILIESLLLQGLVYQHQQKLEQALAMLLRALELAMPERYVRLFIDEGRPMSVLLAEMLKHGAVSDAISLYGGELLGLLEKKAHVPGVVVAKSNSGLLNERELAVVRCAVTGMSNQEIAREMVIAESTVKWYVKNIYSKLGIHNRAQLVVRVNAMNL